MASMAMPYTLRREFLWRRVLFLSFLVCIGASSSPNEWVPRRMSRFLNNDGQLKNRSQRYTSTSGQLVFPAGRRTNKSVEVADSAGDASHQSIKSKMWPPWPFNLLSQPRRNMADSQSPEEQISSETSYRSTAQIFWAYFRQRARIGARQVQQVGSDLWFNLPPAAPPLILLAAIPRRVTAGEVTSRLPPLFANSFARNLALGYLGVAILSWSHSELNRKRRLVPLPLMDQYQDVEHALLPHFLPEDVPEVEAEPLMDGTDEAVVETMAKEERVNEEVEEIASLKGLSSVPPRLKRQLQNFYDAAPRPQTLRSAMGEWGILRKKRKLSEEKIRRQAVMDELIALKSIKKNAASKTKKKKGNGAQAEADKSSSSSGAPLGYALVTGASRGIGRAIAVELARWEIPLILVARDVDRLTVVANEIETCYGVRCCVLQADLSEPNAAERIHQTTRDAGLRVDVLVNNAGVCTTGLSPSSDVRQMIQVNAMSVAMLNHLYGRDMKYQGRGRILVVSSVVGCAPGGPQVAMYTATKAFEKNLALSMGRELEPYGVGVTCLMPGAVRDTAFQSKSGSSEALCWNLPFYTRTAPTVAHEGVRAMLLGQTEVSPGWQNRAFVKLMTPVLPQRLTTLVVESAWTPFEFKGFRRRNGDDQGQRMEDTKTKSETVPRTVEPETSSFWWGASSTRSPRVLFLSPGEEAKEPQEEIDEPDTVVLPQDSESIETDTEIVNHSIDGLRDHATDETPQDSDSKATSTMNEPVQDSTNDDELSTEGNSPDMIGSHEQGDKPLHDVQGWEGTKEKSIASFPAVDDWDDAEEQLLEEWARGTT